jgi:LDH2 family malate/lactate/ureidoglycolate dehydrogenase
MAIRPDLLLPLDTYRDELTALVARIRATPKQPGVESIRIPSERAFRERARALEEGIEIDRAIHEALLSLPRIVRD